MSNEKANFIKKKFIENLLKDEDNFIYYLLARKFQIYDNKFKEGSKYIRVKNPEGKTISIYYNENWTGEDKYSIRLSEKDDKVKCYLNFKENTIDSIVESLENIRELPNC